MAWKAHTIRMDDQLREAMKDAADRRGITAAEYHRRAIVMALGYDAHLDQTQGEDDLRAYFEWLLGRVKRTGGSME